MNYSLRSLSLSLLISIVLAALTLMSCSVQSSSFMKPDVSSLLSQNYHTRALKLQEAILFSSDYNPEAGTLVVVGTDSYSATRGVIAELSLEDGSVVWQRSIPDLSYISDVKVKDGKYYIVGTYYYDGSPFLYFGLVDPASNSILMQKRKDSAGVQSKNILYDSSGIYVSGISSGDLFIAKFNYSGELIWGKAFGVSTYYLKTLLVNDKLIVSTDTKLLVIDKENGNLISAKGIASEEDYFIGGIATDGTHLFVVVSLWNNNIVLYKATLDMNSVLWAKSVNFTDSPGVVSVGLEYNDGKLYVKVFGFTPRRASAFFIEGADEEALLEFDASTGEMVAGKKLGLINLSAEEAYLITSLDGISTYQGGTYVLIPYYGSSYSNIVVAFHELADAFKLTCLPISDELNIAVVDASIGMTDISISHTDDSTAYTDVNFSLSSESLSVTDHCQLND